MIPPTAYIKRIGEIPIAALIRRLTVTSKGETMYALIYIISPKDYDDRGNQGNWSRYLLTVKRKYRRGARIGVRFYLCKANQL